MELDDYQGAIEDFDRLIRLRPHHAAAYECRALCYAQLGNKQLASKNFQKAADLYQMQEQVEKYQNALQNLTKLQQ